MALEERMQLDRKMCDEGGELGRLRLQYSCENDVASPPVRNTLRLLVSI